jgi:hypothetical protein
VSAPEIESRYISATSSPLLVAVSPPDAIHSIKNVGTTPDRLIRVEFKTGIIPTLIHPDWPNGKMPISDDGTDPKAWDAKLDGTIAASAQHKVIYEDETIRVQALENLPGSKEPFHHHARPAVLVLYGERPVEVVDTKGSGKSTRDYRDGKGLMAFVVASEPNALHSNQNLGKYPTYGFRIEFKNGFPK